MTRDGYEKARAALRAGDELVVPAMDRLARNATETLTLTLALMPSAPPAPSLRRDDLYPMRSRASGLFAQQESS